MKKIGLMLALVLIAVLAAVSVNAAVTGCVNAYQYTDNVTGAHNVSVGNVCINATSYDVDPTAAVNCAVLYNCVADAQSAIQYYRGYTGAGTTTCTATGQVATGTTVTYTGGRHILTTEYAVACSAVGYGATYDKTDFKYIVVDGMGTAGASVVEWIDLIVMLIVLGFIIGIFVKMAQLFK